LKLIASERVTTILGFTELANDGKLYNSAAIFHRGSVYGVHRKIHPAINQSVYSAGSLRSVFTLSNVTFGILLCRDSTFSEPARTMAAKGATVFFIPSNNGLPIGKAGPELVYQTRACDMCRALENSAFIVRADVSGDCGSLTSYSTTSITGPDGTLIHATNKDVEQLIVAEVQ
jgi:predicted amidohydrolase